MGGRRSRRRRAVWIGFRGPAGRYCPRGHSRRRGAACCAPTTTRLSIALRERHAARRTNRAAGQRAGSHVARDPLPAPRIRSAKTLRPEKAPAPPLVAQALLPVPTANASWLIHGWKMSAERNLLSRRSPPV